MSEEVFPRVTFSKLTERFDEAACLLMRTVVGKFVGWMAFTCDQVEHPSSSCSNTTARCCIDMCKQGVLQMQRGPSQQVLLSGTKNVAERRVKTCVTFVQC